MPKFLLLFLLLFITFTSCENEAGIRGAINQETISNLIKFITPSVVEKLKEIQIPNIETVVDAGIFKIEVLLSEMVVGVTEFHPESLVVEFVKPDSLFISLQNIQATGHVKARFKLGVITDTEYIELQITKINVNMNLKMSLREVEEKQLPYAEFTKFDLDLDFDFELHGSAISAFINLLKPAMKESLTNQIIDTARTQSIDMLKKMLLSLPVYFKLIEGIIAIDYGFLSNPKVTNDFLLFNSIGGIVNPNIPETKEQRYPFPTNLPEYQTEGKNIQLFVSDYSISTALYTMFKSNLLSFLFKPEMIPATIPIKLTTQWFEVIAWGISKIYGKDKLVEIEMKAYKEPTIVFGKKMIEIKINAEIAINVRINEGNIETAVRYHTDFIFNIDFHVLEEGQVSAFIHNMKLENSSIIESKVPKASAIAFENEFNILTFVLRPILNAYVIKHINIKLPVVKGINFSDSNVIHTEHYIAFNVNLVFEQITKRMTLPIPMKHLYRLQIKCSKGNIIKDISLVEMPNQLFSYKYSCINEQFYTKKSIQFICPNHQIINELENEINQYLSLFE